MSFKVKEDQLKISTKHKDVLPAINMIDTVFLEQRRDAYLCGKLGYGTQHHATIPMANVPALLSRIGQSNPEINVVFTSRLVCLSTDIYHNSSASITCEYDYFLDGPPPQQSRTGRTNVEIYDVSSRPYFSYRYFNYFSLWNTHLILTILEYRIPMILLSSS